MIPEFKNAKKYILKSQEDFFEFAQKHHLGGLFGNIHKRTMPEGNRFRHVYSKTMERGTELTKIASSFSFTVDEVKKDPFIIYEKLFESATEFAKQQVQMTITGISEITELTDNVVQSKGEFTVEDFFESLEKVEIDFDKNGKPRLPSIVGAPDFIDKMIAALKKSEHLPENKVKMDKIIDLKRKQWNDRENNRKLVD